MRYSKHLSFEWEVPVGEELKAVNVEVEYDDGHFLEINIEDEGRDLWDELPDNVRELIAVTAGERIGERDVTDMEWAYDSFYNR